MSQVLPSRYGRTAQALHWLTAIFVALAFVYGLGGSEQRVYASARDFQRHLHETLGIGVVVLTLLRVIWRAIDVRPAPEPASPMMRLLAGAVQLGLYFLLFAVPLSAIAGAWLEGHPLVFLGGLQVMPPITASHALGVSLSSIHTLLGDAIVWLAGVHALAALYHHIHLKDQVLSAMLPRWVRLPVRG
jgi:cytochrome b561